MITLTLDLSSMLLLRGSLADATKQVRSELELLKIAQTRELTDWERAMLPHTLRGLWQENQWVPTTREELIEQINPWATYLSHHEHTLRDICEAIVNEMRIISVHG